MIRKPWPIVIMSFVFFLIPIINIIGTYFVLKTEYSFSDYIYSLAFNSKNYFFLFSMTVPSLLAGFAIFSVKKWSYPLFLGCMLWITIQTFYRVSDHFQFSNFLITVILPMMVNIFYVSYVLLPKVRAAYYDPKLRWWETKPRYLFSTKVEINLEEKVIEGEITNISEGGLFSLIPHPLEANQLVLLKFEILGISIEELKAKIVYRKGDKISHGLQFVDLTKNQKKILKNIIAILAKNKYEVTRPIPTWSEDFINWLVVLLKTGKGFVPEVQDFQNQNQNRSEKKD